MYIARFSIEGIIKLNDCIFLNGSYLGKSGRQVAVCELSFRLDDGVIRA